MTDKDTLIELSNLGWDAMRASIDGLTQQLSWATAVLQPGEYLHSEGSILSQIAHVASGKVMYGSAGFCGMEIRWRDLAAKVDSLWPDMVAIVGWLDESHAYWMGSWANVDDLEAPRPRYQGDLVPGWKLIATVLDHDHYHAGQIQVLRATLAPTSTPPPAEGALWEMYCKDLPSW